MPAYFSKTVAALCDAIAASHDDCASNVAPAAYNDVAEFVREQLCKMPPILRWPVLLATAAFGASRLPLEGSLFHNRPRERRQVQVEIWRNARFGPSRDLMRLYGSLVMLALYSRPGAGARDRRTDG